MNITVPLALFGWPLVILALFVLLPPRRAAITALLMGWLFLPMASYDLPGFTVYNKVTATSVGVLLAMALFDPIRLLKFQPRWFDLPMFVWCVVPFFTSVSNGLGAYDGLSATAHHTLTWGLPYLLGRIYFNDLAGLRELAIGVFVGGLVYIPFCLFEIRMSPQLHNLVYGFHQHSFVHVVRFGGWRPRVFMQNGLALGLWMTIATMVGIWLWHSGALRRLWGVPSGYLVAGLGVVAVLCKSLGAVALVVMATSALFTAKWLRAPTLLVILALLPMLYIGVRTTGLWDGQALVDAAKRVDDFRAESLQYRFDAEDILVAHAMRRPILGWGAWGRNRPAVMGEATRNVATDGLWIIVFGQRGLIGLTALTLAMLVPALLVFRRLPIRYWHRARYGAPVVLALLLVVFMLDSLLNAVPNPIYTAAAGGLMSWAMSPRLVAARRSRARVGPRGRPARPVPGRPAPAGRAYS